MKNQYFGDVNDYRKYGLLRCLTGFGQLTSAICWMLTADDKRADGQLTQYLQYSETWRHYDATLFVSLQKAVIVERKRDVGQAKEKALLPGAWFYDRSLTDNDRDRADYFASFLQAAAGKDLFFFDPDNGMQVKSHPYGRRYSSKYLYWDELIQATETGCSVLVYQHFRREKRERFVLRMTSEFREKTELKTVYSFCTSHVVFFLLLAQKQQDAFERNISEVDRQWRGQIAIKRLAG